MMRSEKTRIILNIVLIAAVLGAWLWMTFAAMGDLSARGLSNLRYFTILSNLMAAIASAVWLVAAKSGDEQRIARAEGFKFVAAAAVMVTFTVVMTFLGPLYGYLNMMAGPNLFFHLLVPLAAACEVVFLTDREFTGKENLLAVLPVVFYGIFYLGNNYINGIGEWPDTNDWYFFLAWGWTVGLLIFAIICGVAWLLGFAMRKAQRLVVRRAGN